MSKNLNSKTRTLPALRALSACALAALLTACAVTGENAVEPVEQRAQARWDALLSEDIDAAYAYLSPGYRSSVSRSDYEVSLRSRRLQWIGAEYKDHSCEEKTCDVRINVKFRVVRPVPGLSEFQSRSVLDEKWIFTSGQWWYLPDE